MEGYTGNGTLGKVLNLTQTTAENFKDIIVNAKDMQFNSLETLEIKNYPLALRKSAKTQMCTRLGVPQSYLKKCPDYLQKSNLNYWLTNLGSKDLLVRLDGENIRAIFTTKYQAINHPAILQQLVRNYGEEQKVHYNFSDDILTLSITNGKDFEVTAGDILKPGVTVINSETGYKAFSIEAFILRLLCTNGMISPVRVVHNRFRHIVSSFFDRLDISQLINQVENEAVNIKVDLQKAVATPVNDVEDTFTKINKRFLLNKPETEATQWGYEQEPGETMYNIINAYTKGAQYQDLTPESIFKLQSVGGAVTGLVRGY